MPPRHVLPERTFDEEIRQDIIPAFSPEIQTKWFGYNPLAHKGEEFSEASKKGPRKSKKTGKKSTTKKAPVLASSPKIKTEPNIPDSDSDIEVVGGLSPPRKKIRQEPDEVEDTEGEEPTIKVQVYLNVETPPPPALRVGNRTVRQVAIKVTPRGPFIFDSANDYAAFLSMITIGARAGHPDCLVRSGMQWRFDRPANSSKKPITNETGFKAMITTLLERKKDWTITVSMPPPIKHTDEVPWATMEDDGNDGEPVDYDHTIDDLMQTPASLSIREQMAGIDQVSAVHMNALLEQYPLDNSPLFPNKRIYSDGNRHFELNDMRLRLWAVGMARGNATIKQPPVSTHFSESQRIRPSVTPTAMAAAAPLQPTIIAQPVIAPQPAPTNAQEMLLQLALTNPALAQLFLQQQQQSHQPPQYPYFQHQPAFTPTAPAPAISMHVPLPAAPLPIPVQSATVPSPTKSVQLPQPVSCHNFCEKYAISEADEAKLDKLEFIPGDKGIEKLGREDWHDEAGFSKLGWERILRKHKEFLGDVVKGLWDTDASTGS